MTKQIKIKVTAQASFLPQESSPENNRFLWSYDITILNESDDIIQLLNRHWKITDMTGKMEEVRGPGVIGLQPIIKPGKQFAYSSFCQLSTPQGTMEGNYEMQNLAEHHFIVEIPKFHLKAPEKVSAIFRSRLH